MNATEYELPAIFVCPLPPPLPQKKSLKTPVCSYTFQRLISIFKLKLLIENPKVSGYLNKILNIS